MEFKWFIKKAVYFAFWKQSFSLNSEAYTGMNNHYFKMKYSSVLQTHVFWGRAEDPAFPKLCLICTLEVKGDTAVLISFLYFSDTD